MGESGLEGRGGGIKRHIAALLKEYYIYFVCFCDPVSRGGAKPRKDVFP